MLAKLTRISFVAAVAFSALSGFAPERATSQPVAPITTGPAACPSGYENLCNALPVTGGSGGLGSQAGTGGKSTVIVHPDALAAPTFGWPDTIDLLAQERSRAEACVDLLKASEDKAAIQQGRIAYVEAKAAADSVIAGLIVTLVQGSRPGNLPRIVADLEDLGVGLQEVCNDAIKAGGGRSKGVIDEIARAPGEPALHALKSSAGALWTRETSPLEIETIKAQLEAAEWPAFGEER